MNIQELIEKWILSEKNASPLWKLPIGEIEFEAKDDPSDGVEIARLAENIRQIGLLHPIWVEKQKKGQPYRLIIGRRRLEACILLGFTHISALIVDAESNDALKIALSENLMRQDEHYIDLAASLQALLKTMSRSDIAKLFSLKEKALEQKLIFNQLTPYEKRLVRLLKLSESDARTLCSIENSTYRKLLLEKIYDSCNECDPSVLIAEFARTGDFRLTQREKPYIRDVRVFLNTIERAAELMRSAGLAVDIQQTDSGDSYCFTITVDKSQSSATQTSDVSRETSLRTRKMGASVENVSRETLQIQPLAIDETNKPWYNSSVANRLKQLQ